LDLLERLIVVNGISNFEKLEALINKLNYDTKTIEKLIELCIINANPKF
jgi:hypothetical protein